MLGRSAVVLSRSAVMLGRSAVVLSRSAVVLSRSGSSELSRCEVTAVDERRHLLEEVFRSRDRLEPGRDAKRELAALELEGHRAVVGETARGDRLDAVRVVLLDTEVEGLR